MNRQLGCIAGVLCLCFWGCQGGAESTKQSKKGAVSVPEQNVEPTHAKDAVSSNDAVAVEVPREYETASLETLFSRILSRGFKTVNKNNNLTRERCALAMRAVTARGMTSVNFLKAKLNQGALGEKALALWLIGSMGSSAKSAARDVSTAMARSWQVPIKRCVKKGGEERTCADATFGREPAWTLMAGCRALKTLTDVRAIRSVAELGLRGRAMLPCLDSFLQHLDDAVIRNQLIDSWDLKAVQDAARNAFVRQPKAALSFALHWLRRIKTQPAPERCPFKEVLGTMNSPIMARLKNKLHPQELSALKSVMEGSANAFSETCVIPYLDAFGTYDGGSIAKLESESLTKVSPTPAFTTGQFCPRSP